MNLIYLLQNQQKLLDFQPLVSYLQEIEKLNADIIFQNKKCCYLRDDEYYYKIDYHLSDGPLCRDIVSIGITDRKFFSVRHTTFSIINSDNDLDIPDMPEKCINDELLTCDGDSFEVMNKVYSYKNDEISRVTSKSMNLSLSEINDVFNPNNFLDAFGLSILNDAKKNNDKVEELRMMIDIGANGGAFTRLAFGTLRHRFVKDNLDDKTFTYTLKK